MGSNRHPARSSWSIKRAAHDRPHLVEVGTSRDHRGHVLEVGGATGVHLDVAAAAVAHDGELPDGDADHQQQQGRDDVLPVVDAQVVVGLRVEEVERQGGGERRDPAGDSAAEHRSPDDDEGEHEGHVGRPEPVAQRHEQPGDHDGRDGADGGEDPR